MFMSYCTMEGGFQVGDGIVLNSVFW